MPKHQHTTTHQSGHIRTSVTMRRGEVISLCRCWQSKNFPLCDGSHKYIEGEKGPVVIDVKCESDFQENPSN
jgi:CDGSH-type Zn-finger protein